MRKQFSQFDCISPVDYRYWAEKIADHLSEEAFINYKILVELSLIKALHRRGLCSKEVVDEVTIACSRGQVTAREVYREEQKTKHDIRALVNCIRTQEGLSEEAKRFIHMTATSYDIIDSANAIRYRKVIDDILIPSLKELEKVLVGLAFREADTIQIGRTHGQHAVPITFGFALAEYVSRLGGSIEVLGRLARELPGKFSGAVGAYNASSLFFDDPEGFEAEVLAELGLVPAEHSTQIVPPEALTRLLSEITIVAGILANLSRDMRSLQRTEIGEVGEEFAVGQVGSSTMPQKRNPINFENVESVFKIVVPRLMTVFMDLISEHQRDLTNSASARTYGEIIAYVVSAVDRLARAMKKLVVDCVNMERNLTMQGDLILAEPLYIILAALGHQDAHEKVRLLTLQAQRETKPLGEVLKMDNEMQHYLEKMTPRQREILSDSRFYVGIAAKKARSVAAHWNKQLRLGLLF